MKTLNIIGAGKVGKTLGYLFHHKHYFQVQHILNRSLSSAKIARDFIGAGQVVQDFESILPADFYLLSVPDDQIAYCCEQLVLNHAVSKKSIVFHCSGGLPSSQLLPVKKLGVYIASAHPVLSISDPSDAINTLVGTFCGLEGDSEACEILKIAFTAIGMRIFNIEAKNKLLYHASLVMASNYFAILMAAALEGLHKAGISNNLTLDILHPMAMALMTQIFSKGPLQALTGPIARGDYRLVAQEVQALFVCDENLGLLYSALGKYTVNIIKEKSNFLSPELIGLMEQSLIGSIAP